MHLKQLIAELPKGHQAKKDYNRLMEVIRFLDSQDAQAHMDCCRCEFFGRGDPLVDPRAQKDKS